MKAKKIIALAFAMIFVVAAAMTVFAKTAVYGKYTCTLTKANTAVSYYTMNVKMRVTNGANSGESMRVRIHYQYPDGSYGNWLGEENTNNAVEIVTSASGAYASGYLGWQAGYLAPSFTNQQEQYVYLEV